MKPTLERLAEYFGAQGYSWSVTVVSDGSTDETDAIVREFSDSHTGFHLQHPLSNDEAFAVIGL